MLTRRWSTRRLTKWLPQVQMRFADPILDRIPTPPIGPPWETCNWYWVENTLTLDGSPFSPNDLLIGLGFIERSFYAWWYDVPGGFWYLGDALFTGSAVRGGRLIKNLPDRNQSFPYDDVDGRQVKSIEPVIDATLFGYEIRVSQTLPIDDGFPTPVGVLCTSHARQFSLMPRGTEYVPSYWSRDGVGPAVNLTRSPGQAWSGFRSAHNCSDPLSNNVFY